MASLMGLRKRLTVPRIEVVSDKSDWVMVVDRSEGASHALVTIRKASESTWNATGPSFTIETKDVPVVVAALQGGDAEWTMRDRSISTDSFTAEDINENAVNAAVEARCSQLDIERAKAANIEEEKDLLAKTLIVQHMDDKHVSISVDGCRYCEAAIANATRQSYDYSDASQAVQQDVIDSDF